MTTRACRLLPRVCTPASLQTPLSYGNTSQRTPALRTCRIAPRRPWGSQFTGACGFECVCVLLVFEPRGHPRDVIRRSPWQPKHTGFAAFQRPRGEGLEAAWARVPPCVDVLVTHTPPLGHGDATRRGAHAGCVDLLRHVETRIRPRCVLACVLSWPYAGVSPLILCWTQAARVWTHPRGYECDLVSGVIDRRVTTCVCARCRVWRVHQRGHHVCECRQPGVGRQVIVATPHRH